jgi:hypothetical protein
MKLTKEACLELGVKYINKYNCYPSAKGWSIKTAGCSRDRVYELWSMWAAFIKDLSNIVDIPNSPCITASHNKKEDKIKHCVVCEKLTYTRNTYCSSVCHKEAQYRCKVDQLLRRDFIDTPLSGSKNSWLRRFLVENLGETCSDCGIGTTHNGKYLLLEIDHVNGRCNNNVIENLRFLCPNCHSQTATYKAKNSKSDRVNRYK